MDIRNIAIIAHVDHGKTTLVDQLLKQSGSVRDNQHIQDRAMDSNDLERERGITILAKCTSVEWKGIRINIVDTPGHADFGGEVERILSMVDGVVLLVDAAESVMPQTKFVLSKALKLGLKPIVIINKIDRSDAQPAETLESIFDLFLALEANDYQLDFHVLYASGRQGWAVADLDEPRTSLAPLFDRIVADVPKPKPLAKAGDGFPFTMLVTTLEADPYLGRILTGRIESGAITVNRQIKALNRDGEIVERARATKLLAFRGLARVPVERAEAGDIIAIAGLQTTTVADTLCDIEVEKPITATPIDPPTLAITISVNDSPLAGREGDKVQSRVIRDRLLREAEGNVAIHVHETGEGSYEVAGRGELQLGVLIEQMRREGFELSISRPRVLFHTDPELGEKLEPIEEVTIDVDDPYTGIVIDKVSQRKGEMQDMRPTGAGKTRLVFFAPSRGLIGYHGEFLTDTRGTGVINRMFHGYAPFKGTLDGPHQRRIDFDGRRRGRDLWPVLSGRSRQAVRDAGDESLSGHDHRAEFARQRSRRQSAEGEAAHQHPHACQRRSGEADAHRAADARAIHRLYRRRRARRSDAAIDPPAQAGIAAAFAQTREGRSGLRQEELALSRFRPHFAMLGIVEP